MSILASKTSEKVYPGQMIDILARVVDKNGDILAASAFSAISLKIFNKRDLSTAITLGGSATAIAIATSQVTGALSSSGAWSSDSKGYNFSYSYDSGTDLAGGQKYVVEVKMTTSAHGIIRLSIDLDVERV